MGAKWATISEDAVAGSNEFAIEAGLLSAPVPYERVVATFNGAFKTTHGNYGMMVNKRVLLPPVAGGASVIVVSGGVVSPGAWTVQLCRAGWASRLPQAVAQTDDGGEPQR